MAVIDEAKGWNQWQKNLKRKYIFLDCKEQKDSWQQNYYSTINQSWSKSRGTFQVKLYLILEKRWQRVIFYSLVVMVVDPWSPLMLAVGLSKKQLVYLSRVHDPLADKTKQYTVKIPHNGHNLPILCLICHWNYAPEICIHLAFLSRFMQTVVICCLISLIPVW